jgi:hypothetical protein
MKTTRLNIILAVLVVVLGVILVPFQVARADMGPKPSMHFSFQYEVDPALTIVSGDEFECQAADCSDAKPLGEMGPQRFGCTPGDCSSWAYGYSTYHRISIEFSDGKTRQSNVFGKKYFEAYYRVTVREDDLLVEELPGKNSGPSGLAGLLYILTATAICMVAIIYLPMLLSLTILLIRNADFPAARGWYITGWVGCALALIPALIMDEGLMITLIVELVIALAYALWRKQPRTKLLTVVLMMNMVTQPVLWFAVRNLTGNSRPWFLAIGEIILWLVEAGILALALRKQAKFREALALSFILNLASFGIGLLLPVG